MNFQEGHHDIQTSDVHPFWLVIAPSHPQQLEQLSNRCVTVVLYTQPSTTSFLSDLTVLSSSSLTVDTFLFFQGPPDTGLLLWCPNLMSSKSLQLLHCLFLHSNAISPCIAPHFVFLAAESILDRLTTFRAQQRKILHAPNTTQVRAHSMCFRALQVSFV